MALTNILLLSQIAGYVIALILSLCITVPMSLHQDEFKGHCLLFSTGIWQEEDGQFKVDWASQAYCNYTIFVGVILFVTSAIQIYRMSMYLYKGTDSSFLSAFVDVVGSLFLCAMTIIAALMITLGFYIEMGTAQFGAWASWACWVGLTVFAVLKLCRYHQLENMRVSMFRERQRLINGNASTSGQENKIGSAAEEKEGPSQSHQPGSSTVEIPPKLPAT
ncbi:Transmembrane protein 179 [Blattella germanica]|nr:Transmembrane protein 179 [Blattella germanica]